MKNPCVQGGEGRGFFFLFGINRKVLFIPYILTVLGFWVYIHSYHQSLEIFIKTNTWREKNAFVSNFIQRKDGLFCFEIMFTKQRKCATTTFAHIHLFSKETFTSCS